jgi:hypothetical protein
LPGRAAAGHVIGMAEPPKVNFVIAGVQKGGTTALFDYLAAMGDVALSQRKETHFFDDESLDWARPDYRPYHALFDDPPLGHAGRPCGEATPIYSYWSGSLERIRAYNPAMRLILILRDPVERAWSHWRMEYARGWETEPFAWCVRQGRARVDSPEAPAHHRVFSYVERGFYGAQFARLLSLFPREQVLALRSEDLDARPDETLARICRFVGAPAPVGPVTPRRELTAKAIDYGVPISDADRAYLRGLFAEDLARFASLSGLDVGPWLGASAEQAPRPRGIWARLAERAGLRH